MLAVNIETNCCENMLITCFAFCLEVWNVIWEMQFRFVLAENFLRRFILVIMLDHLIVSFSDRLIFFWRMMHTHSWLSNDVCLFSICRATSVMRRLIKTWRKRLIKHDESDSSNLTRKASSHQKLTKATHQIFEKKDNFFISWWAIFCSNTWCEELNLADDHLFFCHAKINVCLRLLW